MREEHLALSLYRPLPNIRAFHQSPEKWRLLDGANRCGKTLAGAVELASAVLGYDGLVSKEAPFKPKNGRAQVLGLSLAHIGLLWRKLSEPGAFYCIRDPETRKLRPIRVEENNEIHPEDIAMSECWVEAPPLIPESAIVRSGVSWYKRAERIPHLVTLKSGWVIEFVGSLGRVRQGEHYDFGWIDEAIQSDEHFYELVRGLVDFGPTEYRSRAIWTAAPQTVNLRLWELRTAADAGDPDIAAFKLRLEDNPFVGASEKELFSRLLSERQRLVRVEGVHALETYRVYPRFDPMGANLYRDRNVGANWSWYIGLDPGRQSCGTVVVAVPPEDDKIVVVDSFLHSGGDAYTWANELARRDGTQYTAVVIDHKAGATKTMGQSKSVAYFYMKALEDVGVKIARKGPLDGAMPGCSNVGARIEALKNAIAIRKIGPFAGTARLQLIPDNNQALINQIVQARVDPKTGTSRVRGNDDLLDALEYVVAYNPTYVGASGTREPDVNVYEDFLRRRRERALKRRIILSNVLEVG